MPGLTLLDFLITLINSCTIAYGPSHIYRQLSALEWSKSKADLNQTNNKFKADLNQIQINQSFFLALVCSDWHDFDKWLLRQIVANTVNYAHWVAYLSMWKRYSSISPLVCRKACKTRCDFCWQSSNTARCNQRWHSLLYKIKVIFW